MSKRTRIRVLQIALAATATALIGTWSYFYYGQHKVAVRAKILLEQVNSIQTGVTTEAQLQPILDQWKSMDQDLIHECGEAGCFYKLWIVDALPTSLSGLGSDEGAPLYLARLASHLGLRSVGVNVGVVVTNGVVVQRWFSELTALPVRDWYLRGGAYVPDLAVSSGEYAPSTGRYRCKPAEVHCAANLKGPYAIDVSYSTAETAANKQAYMNFNLDCLTRFLPCRRESEVLPVSERLLAESKQSER